MDHKIRALASAFARTRQGDLVAAARLGRLLRVSTGRQTSVAAHLVMERGVR